MKAMNIPVGVSDFAEIRPDFCSFADGRHESNTDYQAETLRKNAWYEYAGKLF